MRYVGCGDRTGDLPDGSSLAVFLLSGYITEALKTNNKLRLLEMRKNKLTDEGVVALAKVLIVRVIPHLAQPVLDWKWWYRGQYSLTVLGSWVYCHAYHTVMLLLLLSSVMPDS